MRNFSIRSNWESRKEYELKEKEEEQAKKKNLTETHIQAELWINERKR